MVLAQTTGTSPVATAEHVDLLRPLMISGQPGYRIHRPGPQDTFAPHLVAYAPLPRNPAVGVVVQQSQATILDAPELLVVRLAVVGLLALALALAVAWFDVHRVVEPLQMLTAAAKRFAEGQLDDPVAVERGDELGLLVWNARQHRGRQTIAVDRDDEIGLLARSFEQMRRRLRQSLTEIERWNQELERRVAERTEEIARRNRERAQLLAQIMAAQEDERRRLAGELHDEVSQTLASVLIALESLPATEALTPRAQERVRDLGAMIAATIDNVHGLAAELRPSLLDDVGLVAALDRLVGEFRDRHGLPVDFQAVGVDGLRLLPPVETALFRIAQAALNNVHYHAAARAASVLLQRRGDRLLLVVEDDGRGFDLEAVRAAPLKDRLGLAGIEERAQLVGARLTIESEPGHGTSLYVELPVAPNLRAEPPRA